MEKDGFTPTARVPLPLDDNSPAGTSAACGHAVAALGGTLERLRPDILVLLGDRYETLAAALAATIMQVPAAHIHGGEITEGAMDDAFRHAVTKMSHLHFTSCEAYRQRVIQLGETPERVFNVGSLGVENARSLALPDEAEVREYLHVGSRPYFLCTFHSVTRERDAGVSQCRALLEALEAFPDHAQVFTGANADQGGDAVNQLVAEHVAAHPDRRFFFMSLGATRYLAAAKYAACVAGNSSSGIIEVPSFHTPVVDIGDRQKGRIRSASVLHCEPDVRVIREALAIALSAEYKNNIALIKNPYDLPNTALNIVARISTWPLEGLLKKHFYTASVYE